MARFKAWVIEKGEAGQSLSFTDFDEADLMDGDVTVRVTHSCLNYKDGLAMTGASPVVRRFPMIPGIDFSGVVEASDHPDYKPGDAVVLTGWGVGETHLGAYAEKARVKGDWLVPLPAGLSPEQAMAIGTAGYTAMLCLMALDAHGLTPKDGPALVTGASGGVGSVAVALLARAGWHVMASTGRAGEAEYLKSLGAAEIVDRDELSKPGKPLGKERWAVAVDAVGSTTLANVLAQTKADGAVAACGLAQGMDLPTSVAPFILRGVSLLGINSVTTPQAKRRAAWARLADELDLQKLAAMTNRVGLAEVGRLGADILSGKIRGRTVVEIG
ncbi:MDR family oxidoreductase [Methylobacterium sp. HMF5984]|uniref:acrylyl-CoA reductase (NADPH) n=1 Tax=Methylobacterium sp. HMF5984 TaxID=3367370 RepID=UPI003852276D